MIIRAVFSENKEQFLYWAETLMRKSDKYIFHKTLGYLEFEDERFYYVNRVDQLLGMELNSWEIWGRDPKNIHELINEANQRIKTWVI